MTDNKQIARQVLHRVCLEHGYTDELAAEIVGVFSPGGEKDDAWMEEFFPWAEGMRDQMRARVVQALGELGVKAEDIRRQLGNGETMLVMGTDLDRLSEMLQGVTAAAGFVAGMEDEIRKKKEKA